MLSVLDIFLSLIICICYVCYSLFCLCNKISLSILSYQIMNTAESLKYFSPKVSNFWQLCYGGNKLNLDEIMMVMMSS